MLEAYLILGLQSYRCAPCYYRDRDNIQGIRREAEMAIIENCRGMEKVIKRSGGYIKSLRFPKEQLHQEKSY
jgi:hypothetical protein